MSNDTQPEIRFPGFTEAWKQRKLGEVSKIGDIDHRMPPSVDDGIPYLMTGDFIEENELNFENTKLVSEDDYLQLSKKIRPEYGDILFARYASVGAVRYVSTHRKFLISYSCAIIKPFSDYDGQFLYPTLKTQKMQQKIEFEINPNSQKNIGIDSLKKLPLFIPKMDEQQKIGTFFKQLDDTIALHQRKLDLLKETKKGFLQKMFPKNGAKVPEIRFPGFTENWEEKKFKEVINSGIKGKAKAEMSGTKSLYLDTNYLNGGVVTYVDSPRDVENDDVLILWDGSQAGTVYYGFSGALGSTLKAYRAKESGAFLYQQLKRNQQIIYDRYRTPNIPHVVKTFTDEFMVSMPSSEEQNKIGAFFQTTRRHDRSSST